MTACDDGLLQPLLHGGGLVRVTGMEVVQALERILLFLFGGACQLELVLDRGARGIAESVDAHDRQFADVLEHRVVYGRVLDAAAR